MARNISNKPSKAKKAERKSRKDVLPEIQFKNPELIMPSNMLKDSVWLELVRNIEVLYAFPQKIIVITPEILKDLLKKHVIIAAQRRAWVFPLTSTIMFLLPLVTSEFQDTFGFSGHTWRAVFLVCLIISVGWLVKSVYVGVKATRNKTDIFTDIKNSPTKKENKEILDNTLTLE